MNLKTDDRDAVFSDMKTGVAACKGAVLAMSRPLYDKDRFWDRFR
jgi:hypothetical protein